MTTLCLAAALLQAAEFPGGDATALAESLAKAGKSSAIVCAFERVQYPALRLDPGKPDQLADAVKAATGLKVAGGTRLAVHPGKISRHLFAPPIIGPKPSGYSPAPFPEEALKDGVVTLATEKGKCITVGALQSAMFSRPISVHWVYRDLPMMAAIKDLPEVEFLNYVAKVAGARLSASKSEYRLDFEPIEFRTRAKATVRAFLDSREGKDLSRRQASDARLVQAALNLVSDYQLSEAFREQGASTRFALGPQQTRLIQERLALLEEAPTNEQLAQRARSRGGGGQASPSTLTVDTRYPIYLVMRSDFGCYLEAMSLGEGRERGSVVRF